MLEESDVRENNWKPAGCYIEWHIQNFCFALRNEENVLLSSDFILSGCNDFSRWRMNLVVKGVKINQDFVEEGVIWLELERLSDTSPRFIALHWEVSLIVGEKKCKPKTFSSSHFIFGKNKKRSIILKYIKKVFNKYLIPFRDDTIIIKSLIIEINKESTHRSESPAYGLKYLSQDLIRLKEHNFLADVILRVEGMDIKAHKAILCRNKVLESYIEKAENGVIELPNLDYGAVDKFVKFLYSGNIDDILSELSIYMIKCIIHFDKELLKFYFSFEELKMVTRINVNTHEFPWPIKKLATLGYEFISSPPIQRSDMDTIWMLNIWLQPKSKSDHDDCISLLAKIIGGPRPRFFCLELGLQKESGEVFHPRRLIRFNRCYNNLGFNTFINKCDLHPSINIHENINVLFKTRTSDGTYTSFKINSNLNFMPSIGNLAVNSSYEQLSHDLMELLISRKHCNMVISYENKLYYAHKCILAARSIGFSRIISEMTPQNDLVTMEQVDEDSMESVLDYLYSGILRDNEIDKVMRINHSAYVLEIESLAEECRKVLRSAGFDM